MATAALMVAGCAVIQPPPQTEIVQRGVTVMRAGASSELAKGPALLHVYTESTGATVYIARAAAECGDGEANLAKAPLKPELRLVVSVKDGEVACLESRGRARVEVLWHAHKVELGPPTERLRPAVAVRR